MSIQNNTKYSFANALKKILLTKDLHKVRVKEICDLCGAERPTFYYHFKDKYELISWIYEQDFKCATEQAGGRYNMNQLEYLLAIMRKEQVFYQKAFADASQNNLYGHIHETNLKLFAKILKEQFQLRTLTEEQKFLLNFYTYAWIGSLYDWILNKYDVSAREYASWMQANIQHLNLSDLKAVDFEQMTENIFHPS